MATPEETKKEHEATPTGYPYGTWEVGTNIEMAFGQGATVVTPIEEAQAYATFADHGRKYQPEVASEIVAPTGKLVKKIEPKQIGQVTIPPADWTAIMNGLTGVVNTAGHGTAYATFHDDVDFTLAGFPIAGKTGTADLTPNTTKEPNAWFVGFGPTNTTHQYVVAVVVGQGGYGADAAAPAVASIFNYLYHNPIATAVQTPMPAHPASTTPPATMPVPAVTPPPPRPGRAPASAACAPPPGPHLRRPLPLGRRRLTPAMETLWARIEPLLMGVQKPARYIGGEQGARRPVHGQGRVAWLLIYPDTYEIGLPNQGLQILYELLNERDDALAERTYAPWVDMEAAMRAAGVPLFSVESHLPARAFDVLAFNLSAELVYTNLLNLLDLGGVPVRAAERTAADPLVVAGGHCAFNPEPLADFVDAFVMGDGEEVVGEITEVLAPWLARPVRTRDRREVLAALARVEGVYVPSLYEPRYEERPAGGHRAAPGSGARPRWRSARSPTWPTGRTPGTSWSR